MHLLHGVSRLRDALLISKVTALGSESGQPELLDGLQTGGEVDDSAADGSPKASVVNCI